MMSAAEWRRAGDLVRQLQGRSVALGGTARVSDNRNAETVIASQGASERPSAVDPELHEVAGHKA